MCSNYHPATPDKLRFHFGVAQPDADYKDESYPGYMAPIIDADHQCERSSCHAEISQTDG